MTRQNPDMTETYQSECACGNTPRVELHIDDMHNEPCTPKWLRCHCGQIHWAKRT